jgi:hypothetical protein
LITLAMAHVSSSSDVHEVFECVRRHQSAAAQGNGIDFAVMEGSMFGSLLEANGATEA